jgi:hypothetical protein
MKNANVFVDVDLTLVDANGKLLDGARQGLERLKAEGCHLFLDIYKATEWKKYRVTPHTHNPVDDARGNAEALRKFKELGLKL